MAFINAGNAGLITGCLSIHLGNVELFNVFINERRTISIIAGVMVSYFLQFCPTWMAGFSKKNLLLF